MCCDIKGMSLQVGQHVDKNSAKIILAAAVVKRITKTHSRTDTKKQVIERIRRQLLELFNIGIESFRINRCSMRRLSFALKLCGMAASKRIHKLICNGKRI